MTDSLPSETEASDAARYRWLKAHATDVFFDREVAVKKNEHLIYIRCVHGSDLDEAIDSVRFRSHE